MKILVVAFVYLGEDAGSTHTVEVWRHLTKKFEIKILLPEVKGDKKKKLFEKINSKDILFVPFTSRRGRGLLRVINFALSSFMYDLYSIIKVIFLKPDIIYIRLRYLSFAPIFFNFFGKPYVVEVNGLAQYGASKIKKNYFISLTYKLHFTIEKYVLKRAQRIICVTKKLTEILENEYKINQEKTTVIPNGVDINHFKIVVAAKEKLEYPQDLTIIGFVGHFAPWQGMQNVIPALAKIFRNNKFRLVLVGDGMMRPEWQRLCKKNLLEQDFEFIGLVDYNKVPLYINAFDVCLAPFTSIRNSDIGLSPLKLYEYMACAKPVLVSNIQGVGDVVETNQTGIVVRSDNIEDYVNGLRELLGLRDHWPEMGDRGRELVVDQYSWQKNALKVSEVISSL
ncbi:MAG: glycosyltransferase family 4 protein [Patescibacteria group bacterium]